MINFWQNKSFPNNNKNKLNNEFIEKSTTNLSENVFEKNSVALAQLAIEIAYAKTVVKNVKKSKYETALSLHY